MTVAIVGGGAIGGYLAVRLTSGGSPVVIYGVRKHTREPVILEEDGAVVRSQAPITLTTEPAALSGVDLCIVAVKSTATAQVADTLAGVLAPDAAVVSFQNGLDNVQVLRSRLGDRVFGGVVTFHVLRQGHYRRRASLGKLIVGGREHPQVRRLKRFLARGGERVELRNDMVPVLYGKLLLNLNNGICAATGLGIRDVLLSRDARWALAQCVREGLQTMREAGVEPARVSVLPPAALARALLLPDAIVARAAVAFTRMDPAARSSTLDDLDRGHRTEIEALNGGIVRLAAVHGSDAPINRLVTDIVHEHERLAVAGKRPEFVDPEELRHRIESLQERIPSAA